jgi:UDP-MurNAc hydroxylase
MINTAPKLTFLNHASFMIENNDAVLLIDPWYEGAAFNQGWNLLDTSIKNEDIIKKLVDSNKKIFIWFSHEHSDHFAVPFIKKLKNKKIDLTFLYQKTLDGRVSAFLRKDNFKVLELNDGQSFHLSTNFEIKNWKYHSGDSYCWIRCADICLLNLNDCVVDNSDAAFDIANKISSKIDILFTQFGYANWVGNESDKEYRSKVAQEKFERIQIQANILKPSIVIPFASFVYFSHSDNFYLNDQQNTPEKLRAAEQLLLLQENIFFMKPYDQLILEDEFEIRNKLQISTKMAEQHWNNLLNKIQPNINNDKTIHVDYLEKKFKKYRYKTFSNFLIAPQILEFLGFIKPLKIKITDSLIKIEISYTKGFKILNNNIDFDVAMKSDVLDFIFSNDYGYNATAVNGRYKTENMDANIKFGRFFSPQEYLKNGYGLFSPLNTIAMVWKRFFN